MEVVSQIFNETLFINISGELDEYTSSYVKSKLDASFNSGKFKKVIVDLVDLSFMDSTGIGVLIGRYKNLKNKAIPIFITNPNKQIDKIFNMSGLYNIMPKLV